MTRFFRGDFRLFRVITLLVTSYMRKRHGVVITFTMSHHDRIANSMRHYTIQFLSRDQVRVMFFRVSSNYATILNRSTNFIRRLGSFVRLIIMRDFTIRKVRHSSRRVVSFRRFLRQFKARPLPGVRDFYVTIFRFLRPDTNFIIRDVIYFYF